MYSLNRRLLVAASLTLVAFFGLTGVTLDRAFQDSAMTAVRERLQTQVYMLLGAADLPEGSILTLPDALPEARFSAPGSGLYASVVDADGNAVWRSRSMLGLTIPFEPPARPGLARFESVTESEGTPMFAVTFGVLWEQEAGEYIRYTFQVAESRHGFEALVGGFRRSLWGGLAIAALLLLAVQGAILRWSLKPLRQIAHDVAEIEAGHRGALSGLYPKELRTLTENLNLLIRHSQEHLERYRNALADLAHSLKTPLAVLNAAVQGHEPLDDLRHTVGEQAARMNRTVEYQLQRAAASGRIALAAPVSVEPIARKLIASLAKVYAGKSLRFEIVVDHQLSFHGDDGDLMEVLGNLADNACKWARSRVAVRAYLVPGALPDSELVLEVEDDGPGIPPDKRQAILNRGERADPETSGHGIGLAVVSNIVEEVYRGTLEIESGSSNGTRVRARLRR